MSCEHAWGVVGETWKLETSLPSFLIGLVGQLVVCCVVFVLCCVVLRCRKAGEYLCARLKVAGKLVGLL